MRITTTKIENTDDRKGLSGFLSFRNTPKTILFHNRELIAIQQTLLRREKEQEAVFQQKKSYTINMQLVKIQRTHHVKTADSLAMHAMPLSTHEGQRNANLHLLQMLY